MGQYSLSGLAMLSGLGEAISLSGSDLMPAGSQVVTQFTSDNVVSDWSTSRVRTGLLAKGLDYKSWNRSGTGPARHTVKVALEQPMYASQVQARIAEVFQAQGGRGARAFSSNSPYGTRPTSGPHATGGGTSNGSGGSADGVATSDACRARGGVCRDINAMPIRGNEQIVRGLCAGASNIVCVVPRSSSSGGGGGGSAPAPNTGGAPAFQPGIPGDMDWGSWVLVGGSVLFLGAVAFAIVKKRRAARTQMAVANGRRRRWNGQKYIHLQGVGEVSAKPAADLRVGDITVWNYGYTGEVISITPASAHFLNVVVLERSGPRDPGKRYTRRMKKDRLVAVETPRGRGWAGDDLPLPDFTKNGRRRRRRYGR